MLAGIANEEDAEMIVAADRQVRRAAAVDDGVIAEDERQLVRERDGMVRELVGKGDGGARMGVGEDYRRAQCPMSDRIGCGRDDVRMMRH